MFSSFFRSLKGTVRFQAYGGYFEHFMNLAVQDKLHIWNVSKRQEKFYCTAFAKQYKGLAKLAKKSGVHIKCEKKRGFPFLLNRYHKRLGMFIGIAFFFVFLFVMQNCIWKIEVVGNNQFTAEHIIEISGKAGLHKGSWIKRTNFKNVQKELAYQLGNIAWLTVNHQGSCVVIELAESAEEPKMDNENAPSNLVAKKDGVIRKMEIYSGEKIAAVGDVVSKGDLLVSGISEDQFQQLSFSSSKGKVIAETYLQKTFVQPLEVIEKKYTGTVKKRYYFDLFGLKLPLFIAYHLEGDFDVKRSHVDWTLFQKKLPLGYDCLEFKEYETIKKKYTPEEAEKELLNSIQKFEETEWKEVKILSKEIEKAKTDHDFRITINYVCEEDIAQNEPLQIED